MQYASRLQSIRDMKSEDKLNLSKDLDLLYEDLHWVVLVSSQYMCIARCFVMLSDNFFCFSCWHFLTVLRMVALIRIYSGVV